jgi:hypothetical protein
MQSRNESRAGAGSTGAGASNDGLLLSPNRPRRRLHRLHRRPNLLRRLRPNLHLLLNLRRSLLRRLRPQRRRPPATDRKSSPRASG